MPDMLEDIDISSPSPMQVEPEFVGRRQELEQLHVYLSSAFEGKGKTVFVSGTAGSGKSRLANEFLKSICKKEVSILKGWCLSNAAVPYFPFIEAFEAYYSSCEDERFFTISEAKSGQGSPKSYTPNEYSGISAWLRGSKTIGDSSADSYNPLVRKDLTYTAVMKSLLSICREKTAVVLVEDVHWADSASLSLLHYLARSVVSEKVLILATFRSDELNTDSEGRPHPLVEVLRFMGRESLFNEIKLSDLSKDNVGHIAEHMLHGSLEAEFADRLSGESQGNPLFVVESLRMLYEHGSLFNNGKRWCLSGKELGIPSKIRDVILHRLGALKYGQRRVLDVASTIGEKFEVNLLATVLNQDPLTVLETLNAISQATSLVCLQGECYRFDHAKSRETLYDEIPLPLRRGYHSKIAETLENSNKNSNELPFSRLAYHYVEAVVVPKALTYSLAAGEDALTKYSNTEAARHFKYVFNTAADAPQFAKEKIMAQEGLGDALFPQGLVEEALKVYELLGSSAESGLVKLRALRKATAASRWRGDVLHSLELANKASEYAGFDRLEYARVLMERGWASCLRGNAKTGLSDMETALAVFEEEYSLADAAFVLHQAANLGATLNEYLAEKSLRMGLRSVAIFEDLRDFRGQMETHFHLGPTFLNCGLFEEAKHSYEKAIAFGEKVADYNHLAWIYVYFSLLYESVEDYDNAISMSLKGEEYAEKTDAFYIQSMSYANLIRFYARTGDLAQLLTCHRKFVKVFHEVEQTGSKIAISMGKRSLALYFAALDNFREANRFAEESLELIIALHHKLFEAMLRRDYAWVLARQGRTKDAKVQSAEAEKLMANLHISFDHVVFQADLMAPREVCVAEKWSVRLDISNLSQSKGTLIRVEGLVPDGFRVTHWSPNITLENGSGVLDRILDSFKTESVKLELEASRCGSFNVNPQVIYADKSGNLKTIGLKQLKIFVKSREVAEYVQPGRVLTGYDGLDRALLGGIPENFAVALTAPVSDERELLIKRFLDAGARDDGVTFYITSDVERASLSAEQSQANSYVVVCNPRADSAVKNLPNVFKLKGVENLTEINISLLKAFRLLNQAKTGPKRACVEIVSDVLLQHHAVLTRKWLSELIPDLKSKGFTTIAVINPQMHPKEEVQAIMDLFDGELNINEKEAEEEKRKILRVTRLHNQRYLCTGIILDKENLAL